MRSNIDRTCLTIAERLFEARNAAKALREIASLLALSAIIVLTFSSRSSKSTERECKYHLPGKGFPKAKDG